MKIRLLLWKDCHRNCPKCANKHYDLDNLSPVTYDDIVKADEIMLTGGEPMLYPKKVLDTIDFIHYYNSDVLIYMYTAKIDSASSVIAVLWHLDGITVTLQNSIDVWHFDRLNHIIKQLNSIKNKSLHLRIFERLNIGEGRLDVDHWKIRNGLKWRDDCPLPAGEIFRKRGLK